MGVPSPEEIKAQTEKAVSFVQWLSDLLRHRNWVTLLLLLDVILLAVFNPLSFSNVVRLVIHRELPKLYPLFFWLVIALVFTGAVIVAMRTLPHKADVPLSDLSRRSAIKFLRAFGFDDAELFVRLQRKQSLQECLVAIKDRDFRFGILCGESGCGKSSFLQAGLWPALQEDKGHRCVYVKFSDMDPMGAIRQALTEQMQLPSEKRQLADLGTLLAALPASNSKMTVLLLDQFEQFFIHRKLKDDRIPFVQTLAAWYRHSTTPLLKILLSVRGDFTDRLIELQKAMGYSLGPNNYFLLEKFSPDETTDIFRVVAEGENLDFDEKFVKEMAENDLASRKDGLVSPVDIQILAWMISGQKTVDERAFSRTAYQKLGGVEGLLERFLARALAARVDEEQRQGTLKVLIGLTDLDRNSRAGLLTTAEIGKRLAGSMSTRDINEALAWLSRGDVRLVTPGKHNGDDYYELAHERLIPAIRRLAGKQLSLADQANQLLDRRVNEWLGSNGASRYLLNWRELRLVGQQSPYVFWGRQKSQKEALLARSKQRWWLRVATSALGVLLVISLLIWLYSPSGQMWQAGRELVNLSGRIRDKDTLAETVKALAMIGSFGDALDVAERISDPSQKEDALREIVKVFAAMGKIAKAPALLLRASRAADKMKKGLDRDLALGDIFDAAVESAQATKDDVFLEEAYRLAQILPDKPGALSMATQAAATCGKTEQAFSYFKQALQATEDIKADAYFSKAIKLRALAWMAAETAQLTKDPAWWQQALRVAKSISAPHIRAWALSQMTEFGGKMEKEQEASALLHEAKQAAAGVESPSDKAWALLRVSEGAASLRETPLSLALLKDARAVAASIVDPSSKSRIMTDVGETAIRIIEISKDTGLLQETSDMAQFIDRNSNDSATLVGLAKTALEVGDLGKAAEFLERAHQEEISKPAPLYVRALTDTAKTAAEVAKATKNPRFWEQAREIADGIQDLDFKSDAFGEIANVAIEAGEADRAWVFLKQGLEAVKKAPHSFRGIEGFRTLALGAAAIREPSKAFALLEETLQVADRVEDSFYRTNALTYVAQATGTASESRRSLALLEKIAYVASRMENPDHQGDVYASIAQAESKLGSMRQARRTAQLAGTDLTRAKALAGILEGRAERNSPTLVTELD